MLRACVRGCIVAVTILAASIALEAQALRLPIGTRVRVTTVAYTLELPGIRVEPARVTGPILAQDADTMTVQVAGEGPRILPRAPRRITGTVVGADDASLRLGRPDGSTVVIPRAAVGKVQQAAGKRTRGRNALWGLLIGAGGGAAMGAATYSCSAPTGFSICFGRGVGAAGGAILGAGIGAGVGVLMPAVDRWNDVPLAAVEP
jgi:hypothetical protein